MQIALFFSLSHESYFETGGGDNAKSDKKIKSACSRILGIEVSYNT